MPCGRHHENAERNDEARNRSGESDQHAKTARYEQSCSEKGHPGERLRQTQNSLPQGRHTDDQAQQQECYGRPTTRKSGKPGPHPTISGTV